MTTPRYGPSALARWGSEHEEMQDIVRETIPHLPAFHALHEFATYRQGVAVDEYCLADLKVILDSPWYPESAKRKLRRVRAYMNRVLARREEASRAT